MLFDYPPDDLKSLVNHGANVQLIFVRKIDRKVISDNEAHIFKNTVPKNIKQMFDNKVYPVCKKGIIIPDDAIGFIIIGRQLIFDNSNSVIEYYTGKSREDFLGFKSAITVYDVFPPKYFRVGVFLNGKVNENENNMNKYLFNSIHITKDNKKIVSITLNESLNKINSLDNINSFSENHIIKEQFRKREEAINEVKEQLNKV